MYKKYKKLLALTLSLVTLTLFISCEEDDFRIIPESQADNPHTITNIIPDLSDIGTDVTINGTNFSLAGGNNIVKFNDLRAELVSFSDTTLVVTVPNDATSGAFSVQIEKVKITGTNFNVVSAPNILDIDTFGGNPGETIVITGENFSATATENEVQFNGVLAQVSAATKESLSVVIPDGATTGKLTVAVFGQITDRLFTIIPKIESFTLSEGFVGDQVVIKGSNFSADDNNIVRVGFNGARASIISTSLTEITVTVPGFASTGKISVSVNGFSALSDTDYTVKASTTIDVSINSVNDDAEEGLDGTRTSKGAGIMFFTSTDLELGEFDTSGTPDVGNQIVGLRFNEVKIPKNAQIRSAVIIFQANSESGSSPSEMTIFAEDTGNSNAFTSAPFNISSRPKTTANVVWNIEPWAGTNTAESARTTIDISDLIEEIIANNDWSSNNSMSFILEPSGVSVDANNNSQGRNAQTYDIANPQHGARLVITYL